MRTLGKKLSDVLDFSKSSLRSAPVDYQVPIVSGGRIIAPGPLPMQIGGKSTGQYTDLFETAGVGDARTIVRHVNANGSVEDPNGF